LTGSYHPLVVDPHAATNGTVSVLSFTPGG